MLWTMYGSDWPRNCQTCGAVLRHDHLSAGYFDARTGREVIFETLTCPNRWKFWQSHDQWRNVGMGANEWERQGYGEI